MEYAEFMKSLYECSGFSSRADFVYELFKSVTNDNLPRGLQFSDNKYHEKIFREITGPVRKHTYEWFCEETFHVFLDNHLHNTDKMEMFVKNYDASFIPDFNDKGQRKILFDLILKQFYLLMSSGDIDAKNLIADGYSEKPDENVDFSPDEVSFRTEPVVGTEPPKNSVVRKESQMSVIKKRAVGVFRHTSIRGIMRHKLDTSEFICDVTYPDGAFVRTNQVITKTWRIRNSGSMIWKDRRLMRITPTSLTIPDSALYVDIPLVKPGEIIDISVDLHIPSIEATFVIQYKMVDQKGRLIYPYEKYSAGLLIALTSTNRRV